MRQPRPIAILVALLAVPAAARAQPGFSVTTVDGPGDVGYWSSSVIGQDGLPLIAYVDQTDPARRALKVAHCADAACTGATLTTLAAGLPSLANVSLALGADGRGLIAYTAAPSGSNRLYVARCADLACTSATIGPPLGFHSGQTDIAVGTDGVPVITVADDRLVVRRCSDATCTSSSFAILDVERGVSSAALTIGGDGLPFIAYHTFTAGAKVKAAHCSVASCASATTITTIEFWSTSSAAYTKLDTTTGADGLPLIAYHGHAAGVVVARCGNATCASATRNLVATGSQAGYANRIAVGGDGLPVVAFGDYSDFTMDLKLAHCTDAACAGATVSTLDAVTAVGPEMALVIGADAAPVVSYHDSLAQDVKLAHCTDAACSDVTAGVSLSDDYVLEGTHVGVGVRLSAPVANPVTLSYTTLDASAAAGSDYMASSGTVTLAPGAQSARILVQTLADCLSEGDETFLVRISNPVNAVILDGEASVRIVDVAASPPLLSVTPDQNVVGGEDAGAFLFTLKIYPPTSCGAVSVHYATRDGTARASRDYQATSGTATFPPGVTSQIVSIPILADRVCEPEENLFLDFDSPSGLASFVAPVAMRILASDNCFDADSNGAADIVVQRDSGDVSVLASDGAYFDETVWDSGLPAASHELFLADVDADGYADLVVRDRATGELTVRRSTGAGFSAPGGAWSTGWGPGFDLLFGDVNGDDSADLIARDRGNGDVWVLPSTGAAFGPAALWSYGWTSGYRVFSADVTGDGKSDLVAQYLGPTPLAAGDLYVAVSTGAQFVFSGRWSYGWSAGYEVSVADADGDGRADLIGRYVGTQPGITGDVYVMRSTGSGFSWYGLAYRWSYGWGADYDVIVRDFTGDFRADLAGRLRLTGEVHLASSNGSRFLYDGVRATGIGVDARLR